MKAPRTRPAPALRVAPRILRSRRVGLRQLRESVEIRIDVQAVDLLAHCRLQVEVEMGDSWRRRIHLASGAQRHELVQRTPTLFTGPPRFAGAAPTPGAPAPTPGVTPTPGAPAPTVERRATPA